MAHILAAGTVPRHWRTRPAHEKGDDMRRPWAAAGAVSLCLAFGAMPTVAQESSEPPEATPASSPSPSAAIGLPADDGARIVAVEDDRRPHARPDHRVAVGRARSRCDCCCRRPSTNSRRPAGPSSTCCRAAATPTTAGPARPTSRSSRHPRTCSWSCPPPLVRGMAGSAGTPTGTTAARAVNPPGRRSTSPSCASCSSATGRRATTGSSPDSRWAATVP